MKDRYVNPFTGFGFERLFGSEPNKDLLRDFLNALIREQGQIQGLTYLQAEQLGLSEYSRHEVLDVCCESETGREFLLELQKARHRYFKDRVAFYASFPIREQVQRHPWAFPWDAVYVVGILGFVFNEERDNPDYLYHHVQSMETRSGKAWFDKLTYIYLELPKFTKTEDELQSQLDRWLYVIKNLPSLQEPPRQLRDPVFQRFFEVAEIARLEPSECAAYEQSLKIYRDLKNVIDTAREEGYTEGLGQARREQGREEGPPLNAKEAARRMKAGGEPVAKIAAYTGLTAAQIRQL